MEKIPLYTPIDVVKNSARNAVVGSQRFLEGTVTERGDVETWPIEWRDEYHVASYFNDESNALLGDRIITPLQKMANLHGTDYWFAGTAFPFHTTIASGFKKGPDGKMVTGTAETTEVYLPLVENSEINEGLKALEGTTVVFKDLLLVGDNVILNAREIPEAIPALRDTISKLEDEHGIAQKVPSNIFHITIGRLKNVGSEEERKQFVKDFRKLREDIRDNPLSLTLGQGFNGRNMLGRKEDE